MKEQLRILAGAHPMTPQGFERAQSLRRMVDDSEDYSEQEASKLGRLSDWLKAARPVDGKPRAVRSSLNQVAGRRER